MSILCSSYNILHVLLIVFSLHLIQIKMDSEKLPEISIIYRIPACHLTHTIAPFASLYS